MDGKALYLRDDVYFEPLINHWYAWSYLVSPATFSRYLVHTHLRLMRSFLSNHQLHIIASKDPNLAGGEFLNCTEDQVQEISALVDKTQTHNRDLIQLSEAIDKLDELVNSHVSGESIEYLYSQIPGPLKGFVELLMDREHRVSYRILESLLYISDYYKPELQSVSFGSLEKVKERPFVLSTPRLPDKQHLQADLAFDSPILDEIFSARVNPISSKRIKELFSNVSIEGGLDVEELFTESKPLKFHKPLEHQGVRVNYTGHAGFLIETQEVNILIDPVIAVSNDDKAQVMSFSELPERIDYACLTHHHLDHVNLETLIQLRHRIGKIIVPRNNGGTLEDPSLRLGLEKLGFDVIDVEDLDSIKLDKGSITAIPFLGEHGDLNIRSKTAWIIDINGRRMFFGADSANPDIQVYDNMSSFFENIDLFAIGMECVGAPYTWIYGALSSKKVSKKIKESRRLNGANSVQAIALVNKFLPKNVAVYALGVEPCYRYFMGMNYEHDSEQLVESRKFVCECSDLNIEAEMLYGKKTYEFV
ncbi:MBL fold metallo-hydrolase [Paraneptunicella aestuarii]|uniref:MBL fold metallo-hydrolase n=1 Tax=Paraneptunicella aestuarii TaxID=2831148 RepID=UPI001E5F4AF5|nr:MBL fold metallo-hydrolase [Paraneptunicella aestuarii]UAA37223.1 MBL fold metallo-hydrolase [Paraneptunicella aestuarii]